MLDKDREKTKSQKLKKKLLSGAILLVLFLIALWFYRDSIGDIVDGLKEVTNYDLALCGMLALLYFVVEGVLTRYVAVCFGAKMSIWRGFLTSLECEFYRIVTFGSGAGLGEIFAYTKKGLEPVEAAAGSFYKYILKKYSMLLLGCGSFLILALQTKTRVVAEEYSWFAFLGFLLTFCVAGVMICILLYKKIADLCILILEKLGECFPKAEPSVRKWTVQIAMLNKQGKFLFGSAGRQLFMLLLGVCKFLLCFGIIAVIVYGKTDLYVFNVVALMAVSYFLAGVIPTPSGFVGLEFVFDLIFGLFMDTGVAMPAILVFRFFTWIVPALLGGASLFISSMVRMHRKKTQKID